MPSWAFNRDQRLAFERGLSAAAAGVGLLAVAAVPSRLAWVLFGWGDVAPRVLKAAAGVTFDLSAMVLLFVPFAVGLTLVPPLLVSRLRGPGWQRSGALLPAVLFGALLYLCTVICQEVKWERGAFPTVFDMMEGAGNASFLRSVVEFARYQRVLIPMLVGLTLAAVLVYRRLRGRFDLVAWRPWAAGVLAGTLGLGLAVRGVSLAEEALSPRVSSAAVGDPVGAVLESAEDVLQHRSQQTPRQLVADAALPAELAGRGAALLGWPEPGKGEACRPPYARPLDPSLEPAAPEARGRRLQAELTRASHQLFDERSPPIAVFLLSLEGFRSDDVHALHPDAPLQIAPYVSGLYQAAARPGSGVLAGAKVYQAGVRTAQGVGALICGLGTLPYNLSLIRDLSPFEMRCLSDVLHDAGFQQAFYYGSDATFDGMADFFKAHGFSQIVSQAELPKGAPKGTWGGVTDFAVFDRAVEDAAKALSSGESSRFSFVMSLSNHGPFTPPEDLPESVRQRVDQALAKFPNRAQGDDRARLLTFSYTDAAVERFFASLERAGIADRSLVLIAADHSTGHAYVWGELEHETDEAKAGIPVLFVLPRARPADEPVAAAQALLDQAPLSQNDLPAMLLALLAAHPSLQSLGETERWHTLGGQVTSGWFRGPKDSCVIGINGVSQFFALGCDGRRLGEYEDSLFLKTRSDRYRVTPSLIPITAALSAQLSSPRRCSPPPPEPKATTAQE